MDFFWTKRRAFVRWPNRREIRLEEDFGKEIKVSIWPMECVNQLVLTSWAFAESQLILTGCSNFSNVSYKLFFSFTLFRFQCLITSAPVSNVSTSWRTVVEKDALVIPGSAHSFEMKSFRRLEMGLIMGRPSPFGTVSSERRSVFRGRRHSLSVATMEKNGHAMLMGRQYMKPATERNIFRPLWN